MAHEHSHTHDHGHGEEHRHGHGHGHGEEHGHGHGAGEYYLEQLLMIGISGAFAIVAIMMYRSDRLKLILVPQFHPWVLWGGIALFILTTIRVIALWRATAPVADHVHGPDCGHSHGPDCGHDHGHDHAHQAHTHTHGNAHADHDHSHGGIFWRAVVLLFPVALFLMGLPNEGFSAGYLDKHLGKPENLTFGDVTAKGGDVLPLTFADLNAAALNADSREGYQGFTVRVKGQLRKISDKECTLYHLKMTCCAADMIPLKARIVTEDSLGAIADSDWREITGVLQFVQVPGKEQYVPVIRTQLKNIKPTKPE